MSTLDKKQGYIKTENTLLLTLIALTIGFVGGVVFGVYKSGPAMPSFGQMPSGANAFAEHAAEIESLKKVTAEHPDDVESWIELGHLYFDTNQLQKAISTYEQALKINPDNADVLTDLGVMYRRAGNPKEAVAKFDQAIAVSPSHEISRFNKGIVLMHDLEDAPGAVEAWRELIKVNPQAKAPNGQLVKDFIAQFEKQAAAD